MKGHVRKRGGGWAFVVDVDGQRAQRCIDCNARYWVERDRPTETCVKCAGLLCVPRVERRQVWKAGFPTRKTADAELRAFLARVDAGKDPYPVGLTFREWVERWIESERVSTLRAHTVARYRQVLDDYILSSLG